MNDQSRLLPMLLLACLLALGLAACGGDDTDPGPDEGAASAADPNGPDGPGAVLLPLQVDGPTGTARIVPAPDDEVEVLLQVTIPEGAAAVVSGSCDAPDSEVAYELADIADGVSVTVVQADLDVLVTEPHSIVVSSADGPVACGSVERSVTGGGGSDIVELDGDGEVIELGGDGEIVELGKDGEIVEIG